MTTPKLKLHSLADKRPAPNPNQALLTFRRYADDSIKDTNVYLSTSDYIQAKAFEDYERFYVDANDVAAFLNNHNLLELPASKEQQAYEEAAKAWVYAPESFNARTPYYCSLREAFIKFHVEQSPGRSFSKALYTTYCC